MFVSDKQIYYFILCFLFGLIFGINMIISRLIYEFSGKKPIKIATDLISFIVITVLYLNFSYRYNFPSFRVYMLIGVLSGIAVINKSFYHTLAKVSKKVYNIIKRKTRKRKRVQNDGTKG